MERAYCLVSISPVRLEPKDSSEMVSQLLFGEPVTIEKSFGQWAKIKTILDSYTGYCDHKHLKELPTQEFNNWKEGHGFLQNETLLIHTPWGPQKILRGSFIPQQSKDIFQLGNERFIFSEEPKKFHWDNIVQAATAYLNTPYLWGGKTPFGIDCSGLTQTVLRFFGKNIPRDASQQIDCGQQVDFGEHRAGDLAFFHNAEGKIIHVGFCMGVDQIIHASGRVRIDVLDRNGIINYESNQQSHFLHSIRRPIDLH
jgi:hypothetical protein